MQGQQEYQPELFSVFNMEALIPKRHLLRQIDEKIDFGFVREATAELYCENNGRPSIDPVLFIRICFLTYLYNIPSDRQTCEEIHYNLAYRWFCRLSMQDEVSDHSSLTRIRDRLGEKTFKEIFDHVVRLCIEIGLVKGDKVMMDGSFIKADAALSSMVAKEDNLDIKDNSPAKNIKGKKFSNETHESKTDPASSLAGKKGESKQLRYKVHESIDRDSRIILDAHITAGNEVDGKQMLDRIDHIEETFNITIKEFTGDRGYGYGENLDDLQKRGIKSYVPNFHEDVGENIDPELFKYDEEKDHFVCLKGHELTPANVPANLKEKMQIYRILGGHCTNCPMRDSCFSKDHKEPRGKRISRNIYWKIQAETAERERTRDFRRVKGERQWKMEGVFAEAKDNHGLERARYRGRAKMQIQAYMIAVVQNLKRYMGHKPAVAVAIQQFSARVAENLFSAFALLKFQAKFEIIFLVN